MLATIVSKIKIKKIRIFFVVFSAALFLLPSQMLNATNSSATSDNTNKSQIDDLKSKIEMYQGQIDAKSQKQESINNDIEIIGADINKIELQSQETELEIANLTGSISQKETEITELEKQITAKEQMLGKFLQELYERGGTETQQIILGQQSFSEYYAGAEDLENFENQINEIHDQLEASRNELKQQESDLIQNKIDKESMRAMQDDQQKSLESEKQMESLLVSKIGDEKQALQENVDALRAELNNLQALGSSINMDEAIATAKDAAKITGVAPEFLLGVLRVESGLGTNVGGGRYKTDMNPNQWSTFKSICKELGLDPDKMPVSRRACYDKNAKDGCGGWGGAMGPAQFMPSTWMGYKAAVEKAMGHEPANPWALEDSLVAMGLKLGSVDGVKDGNRKAWAKAAGMYLAGSNWDDYGWYSDRVLYYTDGFKKIMKGS